MKLIKILLLDDDENNEKVIKIFFNHFGGEVFFTSNVSDAISNLEMVEPSLSFASLKLARANDWTFLKKAKKTLTPIIGLVKNNQSFLMKEAKARGINSYLVKPVDDMHLKTYLPSAINQAWAIKKRMSSANERRFHSDRRIIVEGRRWYDRLNQIGNVEIEEKELEDIGPFSVCSEKKCIVRNGENIKLTPKEYKLFSLLFKNMDQVVSIDTIISHIWNLSGRASEEDVKQYIYMLRKKIEENPSKPSLIINHKGFGYMFSSEILSSVA